MRIKDSLYCADCKYHDCKLDCTRNKDNRCTNALCTLNLKTITCYHSACGEIKKWQNGELLDAFTAR